MANICMSIPYTGATGERVSRSGMAHSPMTRVDVELPMAARTFVRMVSTEALSQSWRM